MKSPILQDRQCVFVCADDALDGFLDLLASFRRSHRGSHIRNGSFGHGGVLLACLLDLFGAESSDRFALHIGAP